jgi:1-deoxy-D-xylulose-5-phosphate reductoisomerase
VKRISILGSTGSIGVSTLDVVAAMPGRFRVAALAAGGNVDLLASQVARFNPEIVAVRDAERAAELTRRLGDACAVVHGPEGLIRVATQDGVEMVVSALVGAVGLEPTYAALDAGIDVALANKEALVVAGAHMTRRAAETRAAILPVDSEHNALHQCLRGERAEEVANLWLTASGGPFRGWDAQALAGVTVEQALDHPTWNMGPKITIDSATLMNKGLEVIEARWLFDVAVERIRVVVHPQSIVHSMVELVDGSFKAQLGVTDMKHPIQYALSWPQRWRSTLPRFDPAASAKLEFEEPDRDAFPCLGLAYDAVRAGGAAPAVLNAANEIAVEGFLQGQIDFPGIPRVVGGTLDSHGSEPAADLGALRRADARARATAQGLLQHGVRS